MRTLTEILQLVLEMFAVLQSGVAIWLIDVVMVLVQMQYDDNVLMAKHQPALVKHFQFYETHPPPA